MEPVSLLILAGGRSTRMGRDKAWLDWEGRPLVEYIALRLAPLAQEILISTNEADRYRAVVEDLPLPARLIPDEFIAAGPLAGLHAGLHAAHNDLVFTAATDMPFVNLRLASQLLEACEDAEAVLPRLVIAGQEAPQPEPLFAAYRRTCLPAIEAALAAGRRRAISFLDDVRVRYMDEEELRRTDPGLRTFRNVNTPEEWAKALEDSEE